MYLSRLSLSRDPAVEALSALLNPADIGRRTDAHHRLIWSVFAGDPQAKRDFLWRDEGDGRFLVLSPKPPKPSGLFDAHHVKEFTPDLRRGDRLSFLLRANATRSVKTEAVERTRKTKSARRDVVMDALHPIANGARARVRMELAQQAGAKWLDAQAQRAGFTVLKSVVTGYRKIEFANPDRPRDRNSKRCFGVIDLEGVIEIVDPAAFMPRLMNGFGRAKAFGCGLMLIRRA